MNKENNPIHQVGHLVKMRWDMVPNINWFLAIPPAKLGSIGDRGIIQGPKGVLVEGFDALRKANLNRVESKSILPEEVLLLYSFE